MAVSFLSPIHVLFFCFLQNTLTYPTVKINDTLIIGQGIKFFGYGINQYLGIPYAEPPVGPLRFKKPVAHSSNIPFFYAFTSPPACPQYSQKPYPWYFNSPYQSEDCLYMNIWTPADASPVNKKAVMYWIYGGAFRYGTISDSLYSGIPLASLGDIIVVTVNYRVGPFGFLCSGTDDAPGNVGLYDALEGLRWVNRNIGAFGGDGSRITIAGESAGSRIVGSLAVSPMARGLYTRQILESGSPFHRDNDNKVHNIALSQKLANNVGCASETFSIERYPEEVVRCLRGVDAATLSIGDFFLAPRSPNDFIAQLDQDIIPDDPLTTIINGDFKSTDLLIGHNKDEGSFIVTTSDPELYGFFGKKNPDINKTLGEDMIRKSASRCLNPQSIVNHYVPENLTDPYRIRQQVYTALGDMNFKCPNVYYAEKCAEQGRNVYYYVFTHRPSVTPWAEWMGTAHFEEVQFVFGQPVLHPEKYQPSELLLSRQMIDIWSSFVKHGMPNLSWALYSKEDPAFKFLGPEDVTEKNSAGGPNSNCDFLRPFQGCMFPLELK